MPNTGKTNPESETDEIDDESDDWYLVLKAPQYPSVIADNGGQGQEDIQYGLFRYYF